MKRKSFKQKCLDSNVNYNTAKAYKRNHKELTDEQIIEHYIYVNLHGSKPKYNGSFKQKCDLAGVDYERARNYRRQHRELDDDAVIKHTKLAILRDKCNEHNLSYNSASAFWARNSELSIDDVIKTLVSNIDRNTELRELKQMCADNNVDYSKAYTYKYNHWDLTNEQVIEYYLIGDKSLAEMCREAGVKYTSVMSCKKKQTQICL